jgi:hypothetical protein
VPTHSDPTSADPRPVQPQVVHVALEERPIVAAWLKASATSVTLAFCCETSSRPADHSAIAASRCRPTQGRATDWGGESDGGTTRNWPTEPSAYRRPQALILPRWWPGTGGHAVPWCRTARRYGGGSASSPLPAGQRTGHDPRDRRGVGAGHRRAASRARRRPCSGQSALAR